MEEKKVKKKKRIFIGLQIKLAIYAGLIIIIFSIITIGIIAYKEEQRITENLENITELILKSIQQPQIDIARYSFIRDIIVKKYYLFGKNNRNKRELTKAIQKLNEKIKVIEEIYYNNFREIEKIISKNPILNNIYIVSFSPSGTISFNYNLKEITCESKEKSKIDPECKYWKRNFKKLISTYKEDSVIKKFLNILKTKNIPKLNTYYLGKWFNPLYQKDMFSIGYPILRKRYIYEHPEEKYTLLKKAPEESKKLFLKTAKLYEPPIGNLKIKYYIYPKDVGKIFTMFLKKYRLSIYALRNIKNINEDFLNFNYKTEKQLIPLDSIINRFIHIKIKYNLIRKDYYYNLSPIYAAFPINYAAFPEFLTIKRYGRFINLKYLNEKDFLYTIFNLEKSIYHIDAKIKSLKELALNILKRELLGLLILRADWENVKKKINKQINEFLDIAISVFIRIVFLSYVLGLLIVKHIKKLQEAAQRVGKGDFSVRVNINSRDEVEILSNIFNQMVIDLEKAQKEHEEKIRMEEELKTAEAIQKALLPEQLPQIPNLELAGYYAAQTETGGDYYDFIPIKNNNYMIVIMADVSNHGVGAGLVMTMARTIVHTFAETKYMPKDMMEILNKRIKEDTTPYFFITMFYGLLDIKKRKMVYGSAGHMESLLFRKKQNKVIKLPAGGIPIGVMDNEFFMSNYEVRGVEFSSGDVFLQYTDGVIEAINQNEEEFGMERLISAFEEACRLDLNANEIIETIVKKVKDFTGNVPQSDDITISIIKFL